MKIWVEHRPDIFFINSSFEKNLLFMELKKMLARSEPQTSAPLKSLVAL
jgi:hypothetical protein